MSKYTEESLNKMLKRDLIPIVLNLQSTVAEKNNNLLEEQRITGRSLMIILVNFSLNWL